MNPDEFYVNEAILKHCGKPLSEAEIASMIAAASNPNLCTATNAMSTDKMPTIDELYALVKKFAPPPVIVPADLLAPGPPFFAPQYGPSMISTLYKDWLKQDLLGAYSMPGITCPFCPPVPLEPIRRRQLAHDDCHLFARPETKDRGQVFDEQELLRAASGTRSYYVWSEVLGAHVRMGESLKG